MLILYFCTARPSRYKNIRYKATMCCHQNTLSLQWRHNGPDGVSNPQPHDCLLNRLFRRRPKKTSKLPVTCLCEGNSPVTGEFPAQRASNAENVSIWWRHHDQNALHYIHDRHVLIATNRLFNSSMPGDASMTWVIIGLGDGLSLIGAKLLHGLLLLVHVGSTNANKF